VAIYARCGGTFNKQCSGNLLKNLSVKKNRKSVKIWQNYCHAFRISFSGPPCMVTTRSPVCFDRIDVRKAMGDRQTNWQIDTIPLLYAVLYLYALHWAPAVLAVSLFSLSRSLSSWHTLLARSPVRNQRPLLALQILNSGTLSSSCLNE